MSEADDYIKRIEEVNIDHLHLFDCNVSIKVLAEVIERLHKQCFYNISIAPVDRMSTVINKGDSIEFLNDIKCKYRLGLQPCNRNNKGECPPPPKVANGNT